MKIIIIIIALLFYNKSAFAYLDPGSLQAFFALIASGFVGVIISIKFYWYRIKSFFSKIFIKKHDKKNK